MANLYISSAQYAAVAAWTALTAYVSTANGGRGDYVRQLATPAVGSERVFRCTTSGTSGAAEPTWTLTKNAVNAADGTATWTECTGQAADQVAGAWKAPHATLAHAFASTWGAAGDDFYVGNDHAETAAATKTLTSPGTHNSPSAVYCVNIAGGSIPPVAADLVSVPTGQITTTGAFGIVFAGQLFCWGMIFNAASGAVAQGFTVSAGVSVFWQFDTCAINKKGTSAGYGVFWATGGYQRFIWRNTTWSVGNTGDLLSGVIEWFDTPSAIQGATIPTTLFGSNSLPSCVVRCRNVDFSAVSGTIFGGQAGPLGELENCKLHASATLGGFASGAALPVAMVRSGSAAISYNHSKAGMQTSHVVETTIVRTGGASDGVTPIAWKFSGSVATFKQPFLSMPLVVWNPSTSLVTVTVYGVCSLGAVPTQADLWLEVSYPVDASSPLGSVATSGRATPLTTAASYSSDSSTWGGSTTKFIMVATFTPAQIGYITGRIKYARASGTFYIDPKLYLS